MGGSIPKAGCCARVALGSLFTALVLTMAATGAGAGTVSGSVVVKGGIAQRATLNPYPGMAGVAPDHAPASGGNPQDVVLFIDGVSLSGSPKRSYELLQRNVSFHPRVLAIPVGASVAFPNGDMVFHNVFSYSKTRRFDLGHYGKGKSKSITFDKPGLVKVFCDIHATMSAFILVADTPFVTTAGADGSYRFDGVPAGNYTVKVWHPDHGERTFDISVGDGRTKLDITL